MSGKERDGKGLIETIVNLPFYFTSIFLPSDVNTEIRYTYGQSIGFGHTACDPRKYSFIVPFRRRISKFSL